LESDYNIHKIKHLNVFLQRLFLTGIRIILGIRKHTSCKALQKCYATTEFVKLCCTTYKKVLIFEKKQNDFCTRIFNKISNYSATLDFLNN